MADNQFIPASPENIIIRPLDKGVVNHISPGMVPKGGFLEVSDFQVSSSGLEQRPPLIDATQASDFVEFPPLNGIQEFWTTGGVKRTLISDRKFFYEIGNPGADITTTRLAITAEADTSASTASVAVTSADLTMINGTGTTFAVSDIQSGDIAYVDINGSWEGKEIKSIPDDTHLKVDGAFSAATSGTGYEVLQGLYNGGLSEVEVSGTTATLGDVVFPDAVSIAGKTITTDGLRGPRVYDGVTWQAFTSQTFIPVCVGYFRDRLFFGQMMESSGKYYRQRIRWSEAGDVQLNNLPEENYIDLPYQSGGLWRLVRFAQTLIAFFDDAVYIGRSTSSSALPVFFEKVETGGVGLVGMRAIASWMDSVFFAGRDDIYMITPDEVKPVGTAAVKKTLKGLGAHQKGHIAGYTNTREGKIGFAFPGEPEDHEERLTFAWEMDVASGAWSKITFNGWTGFIKEASFSAAVTIDAMTQAINDVDERIDNFTSLMGDKRLYIDKDGTGSLGYFDMDLNSSEDYEGDLIQPIFETGDIDVDKSDMKKLWNRFSVKLSHQTKGKITFQLWVSTDRGQQWKGVGDLVIDPGRDEGKANFRIVGSQLRVRLKVMENDHGRFEITEMGLRVKPRGRELRFE